jgi:hypothetical protein
MTSLESKNEMLVIVLTDLAGVCRKLANNSALKEERRARARQFVEEFDALLPNRGKGNEAQHFAGEQLLIRMARFLPSVVEVDAIQRTA